MADTYGGTISGHIHFHLCVCQSPRVLDSVGTIDHERKVRAEGDFHGNHLPSIFRLLGPL